MDCIIAVMSFVNFMKFRDCSYFLPSLLPVKWISNKFHRYLINQFQFHSASWLEIYRGKTSSGDGILHHASGNLWINTFFQNIVFVQIIQSSYSGTEIWEMESNITWRLEKCNGIASVKGRVECIMDKDNLCWISYMFT